MVRRNAIVSLAGLIASVLLPSTVMPAGKGPDVLIGGLLDILVPDSAAAARLGRRYLDGASTDVDLRRLADGVLASLHMTTAADNVASTPESVLIDRARRRVIDDYVAGRVVEIDGWLLSITEARLYALAALAEDRVR